MDPNFLINSLETSSFWYMCYFCPEMSAKNGNVREGIRVAGLFHCREYTDFA